MRKLQDGLFFTPKALSRITLSQIWFLIVYFHRGGIKFTWKAPAFLRSFLCHNKNLLIKKCQKAEVCVQYNIYSSKQYLRIARWKMKQCAWNSAFWSYFARCYSASVLREGEKRSKRCKNRRDSMSRRFFEAFYVNNLKNIFTIFFSIVVLVTLSTV